ncbi:MAG: family 43 glycosylhydrolase [Butyrivibrio sp.]|nr:family 43 glycosylhydrolase [Butyrivibrio sp.]
MSVDGLKAITEDHFIFDGNNPEHPAVTIEGPKVYKRNGYYYIFAPAGGVKTGWQVVLRSKNIYGPFDIKTVMHQGNTIINGPHQGAWIDTESGEDWFLHFQDRGLYGRIMHVQPMKWVEDWPVIGVNEDENGCGEPAIVYKKPNVKMADKITSLTSSDDFVDGKYGLMWQWLGNHKDSFCSKTDDNNGLRLYALNPSGDEVSTIWRSANVLTQKLVCPYFSTDFLLDYSGLQKGDRAGCVMMGGQYACIYIKKTNDAKYILEYAESEGEDNFKKEKVLFEKEIDNNSNNKILELSFSFDRISELEDKPVLHIAYSIGNSDKVDIGASYTPSDHTWVGAKIGIFALTDGEDNGGFADFKYVKTIKL